jgi:hypothetical protein
MSDPEIDRRCSICGASVRPSALFCPQCGQPITNQPKTSEATQADEPRAESVSENNDTIGTAQKTVVDLAETQPLIALSDLAETKPLIAVSDLAETKPLIAVSDLAETKPLISAPDLSQTQPLTSVQSVSKQSPTQKHPNLQRATDVARGLEENVMGRVEKLRKVSSVVIDQAAYDPSVRFLLVAAGLFLLFLFLLILSKVIG